MLDLFPISETGRLLARFPKVELSYETISHKKVLPSYDIAVAIPHGKKYFAWFSFYGTQNVVYLMELNKERKIVKIHMCEHLLGAKISCDTVLYGVYLQDVGVFMIEDLLTYQGVSMKQSLFQEKLPWLYECLEKIHVDPDKGPEGLEFRVPAMWSNNSGLRPLLLGGFPPQAKLASENTPETLDNRNLSDPNSSEEPEIVIPEKYRNLPYTIHHIQYRSFTQNLPWVNYPYNAFATVRKIGVSKRTQGPGPTIPVDYLPKDVAQNETQQPPNIHVFKQIRADFNKPQYRMRTVFQVTADIQYDIYHLNAYGQQKKMVYYNVAYIPNYKTSVMMNRLFRTIRENENLDAIEESDDEDDFQNVTEDKYVNLQKTLLMECQFHPKFKRWVPMRVMNQQCKVVHISQL